VTSDSGPSLDRRTYTPRTDNVLTLIYNSEPVGEIVRAGKDRYRLRYFEVAASEAWFTPLSVGLPAGAARHSSERVRWWLSGLLPDRPPLLLKWRKEFGVTDLEPFALLRWVGEDVTGGFQFVRAERLDAVLSGSGALAPIGEMEVAQRLAQAKADVPLSAPSGGGKFSLPGAQAKIALNRTHSQWADPDGAVPSTHILKPAVPGYVDQDLCEFMTMTAAQTIGLTAARSEILQFGVERAFVTTRYDRDWSAGALVRIHQEDMCQALGMDPFYKYENQGGPGAAEIAGIIQSRSSAPVDDCARFAQALVYNWLICGTDAHARNYSLMLLREDVRLAPLYDLNGHLAFDNGANADLSMSVNGKLRAASIRREDWVAMAPRLFVDADWLVQEIERQATVLPDALSDAAKAGDVSAFVSDLPSRYVENVATWCAQRLARVRA